VRFRLRWRYAPLVVLAVVLGAAVPPALALWPLLVDDWNLDRIVASVALDWRDFGPDSARQRLQYELDAQEVGHHVKDEDCQFHEEGSERRLVCRWDVTVEFPLLERPLDLVFSSIAGIDAQGRLTH